MLAAARHPRVPTQGRDFSSANVEDPPLQVRGLGAQGGSKTQQQQHTAQHRLSSANDKSASQPPPPLAASRASDLAQQRQQRSITRTSAVNPKLLRGARNGLHKATPAGDDVGETSVWTPGVAIPLETLLQPPPEAAPGSIKLTTHAQCLAGWVEQGSPCCAAASIAGAFNALRGVDAQGGDVSATQAKDVLPLLQDLVRADLAEKRAQLARTLNLPRRDPAPLALLMSCVESAHERKGRPLTGRKEQAVSAKELRQTLRELAAMPRSDSEARVLHQAKGRPPVDEKDELTLWARLRWGKECSEAAQVTQAQLEGQCAFSATHTLASQTILDLTGGGYAPSAASDDHSDTATATAAATAGSSPAASAPAAAVPTPEFSGSGGSGGSGGASGGAVSAPADSGEPIREEAALVRLAQTHTGWVKISHDTAPSTAAVGNSQMISATNTLSAMQYEAMPVSCPRITIKKMCGLRGGGGAGEHGGNEYDWIVSEDDSPDVVELQWHRLIRSFEDPESVILAHYWNHYALFFAMREWRHGATGHCVREILTAKPGQRPGRWVSWHEMRKWLIGWHGYCLFKFELLDSSKARQEAIKPWHRQARAEAPAGAPAASAPTAAPASAPAAAAVD